MAMRPLMADLAGRCIHAACGAQRSASASRCRKRAEGPHILPLIARVLGALCCAGFAPVAPRLTGCEA